MARNLNKRKCAGCNELKDKKELIKITKQTNGANTVVKPDSKTFGRSAYLCYNASCIEASFKKNKLQRALKATISEDLKGQLLNELREN